MTRKQSEPTDEVPVDAEQDTAERAAAVQAIDGDLAAELAAEKDRALRLQAEMQNVRNRSSREIADVRKYAALPVVRELLPIVDNVDRAIAAADKASDGAALLEGFRLVRQQLATLLAQNGVQRIEAVGKPFDPDYHHAILHQPSDEHDAGTVVMETQAGYQLQDRVVRPAEVIVSSGPPQADIE